MSTVLLCLLLTADPTGAARSLVSETRQMTLHGDWDAAVERLDSALMTARGDDATEALLRVERGRVLADRNFFHRSDPGRARQAIGAGLRSARRARHEPSVADGTQALGQLYFSQAFRTHDWEKPRRLFREAVALRERLGDTRGVAQSTFYLGLTFEQQSPAQIDVALEHYRRALSLSTDAGDKVLQSYAHRHIGGIKEERGQIDEAFLDISRSVELRREGGFTVGVPFALLQKADFVAKHRQRLDEAIMLTEEAISVAEAAHSTRALAETNAALAQFTLQSGHRASAAHLLERAVAHAKTFGDPELVRALEKELATVVR
jgi:tetratricopeptide (TPR) repeat protein